MTNLTVSNRELSLLDVFQIPYTFVKTSNIGYDVIAEVNIIDELNKNGVRYTKDKLFEWADLTYKTYNISGEALEKEIVHILENLSTKFNTKPKEHIYKLIPLAVEAVDRKYKTFFEKEVPKEDVPEKSITDSPFVPKEKYQKGWEEFLSKNLPSETAIQALLTIDAITDNDLDHILEKIKEETSIILNSFASIQTQLLIAQDFIIEAPTDAIFIVNTIKPQIENLDRVIGAELLRITSLLASMEARSKLEGKVGD